MSEQFARSFVFLFLTGLQRVLSTLEVFVCFEVAGMALRDAAHLGLAHFRGNDLENFRTQLVLNGEKIGQHAVEPLGP